LSQSDNLRLVTRLSVDYFLRSAHVVTDFLGGDILTALVFLAINAANVDYLNEEGPDGFRHTSLDDPPPDGMRRPVSVLAVAGSLGLSYETTRRHANKLLREGLCTRVPGGLVAPTSVLNGEHYADVVRVNLVNVKRLFRGLRRANIDLD